MSAPGTRRRIQACLAALAVASLAAGLASCGKSRQPAKPAPTAEEKAYLQNIQFAGSRVEAARNFLGHTVTTLHATITNSGKKPVASVEVGLTFFDIDGKAVEQKTAYPINDNTPPLKPGESRDFQVSFDEVPDLWNQAPPQITPVRVILAEK